jgi:UPF0755 protein
MLALAAAAGLTVPVASAQPEIQAQSPTLEIIFPEGYSARQMADQVAHVRLIAIHKRRVTPVLTGTSYAAATARAAPPASFAASDKRHSIEGFLFPAGYFFDATETASQLIAQQLQTFAERWATVKLDAQSRKIGSYGVLTIASMVEREAAVPAERPLIAAVIYNRLAKGMPLGIDATIRYGLGIQGTRPLTSAELRSQSPYNTDIFPGLPPTPIDNPGLPSLRAAAAPAAVDYLYYLRRPSSKHHFFTADESVFCQKSTDWGYGGCTP